MIHTSSAGEPPIDNPNSESRGRVNKARQSMCKRSIVGILFTLRQLLWSLDTYGSTPGSLVDETLERSISNT